MRRGGFESTMSPPLNVGEAGAKSSTPKLAVLKRATSLRSLESVADRPASVEAGQRVNWT